MEEIGEIELLHFEHLPQEIFENIAEIPHGQEFIETIRKLPLDKSVPLLMQVVLQATPKEVAEYHKISVRAVYKKNKSSLKILQASLKHGSK